MMRRLPVVVFALLPELVIGSYVTEVLKVCPNFSKVDLIYFVCFPGERKISVGCPSKRNEVDTNL